jgi:hypothetical protein
MIDYYSDFKSCIAKKMNTSYYSMQTHKPEFSAPAGFGIRK